MLIISNLQKKLLQELGYAPDFEKQKDFIQLVLQSLDLGLPFAETRHKLYDISRFLLCQQEKDEARFSQIFDQIFDEERSLFEKKMAQKTETIATQKNIEREELEKEEKAKTKKKGQQNTTAEVAQEEEISVDEPWKETSNKKYLNFMPEAQDADNQEDEKEILLENFLFTEDYHIVSFREMIQSWRYFRLRQKQKVSNEIDIAQTVARVAQEGFFTEVAYQRSQSNREDALLILVDRRGSMAPFHSLTEHLVRTAITEGGHHKAKVFYFQNYPLEHVYRTPQLTNPVKLEEIFSSTSSEHTYALILSDAGAARGNENAGRIATSVDFVNRLWHNVKDVVWLNPMPRNRWRGTSAAQIAANQGVKMYALSDANRLGMTLAIKDLLYEN